MALELDPIEIPAGQPSGLQLDPVNTVIKPIPLPKQPEAPLQMPPTFTNAINSLSKMSAPAINFISDMQQPRIPPPPQPDIFANAPGFSLPAPSKPTIDFSAPSQSYPSYTGGDIPEPGYMAEDRGRAMPTAPQAMPQMAPIQKPTNLDLTMIPTADFSKPEMVNWEQINEQRRKISQDNLPIEKPEYSSLADIDAKRLDKSFQKLVGLTDNSPSALQAVAFGIPKAFQGYIVMQMAPVAPEILATLLTGTGVTSALNENFDKVYKSDSKTFRAKKTEARELALNLIRETKKSEGWKKLTPEQQGQFVTSVKDFYEEQTGAKIPSFADRFAESPFPGQQLRQSLETPEGMPSTGLEDLPPWAKTVVAYTPEVLGMFAPLINKSQIGQNVNKAGELYAEDAKAAAKAFPGKAREAISKTIQGAEDVATKADFDVRVAGKKIKRIFNPQKTKPEIYVPEQGRIKTKYPNKPEPKTPGSVWQPPKSVGPTVDQYEVTPVQNVQPGFSPDTGMPVKKITGVETTMGTPTRVAKFDKPPSISTTAGSPPASFEEFVWHKLQNNGVSPKQVNPFTSVSGKSMMKVSPKVAFAIDDLFQSVGLGVTDYIVNALPTGKQSIELKTKEAKDVVRVIQDLSGKKMEDMIKKPPVVKKEVPVAEPTAPETIPIAPTAPEITQEAPIPEAPQAPPIAEAPVPVTPEAPVVEPPITPQAPPVAPEPIAPEKPISTGYKYPAKTQSITPEGDTHLLGVKQEDLYLDPERFQYKLETNKQGVEKGTERPWNSKYAGTIHAWRDPADSKLYVINGHHRYNWLVEENAKRVAKGLKPLDMPSVLVLENITADQARAAGASINISEGRGKVIDAATYFRERKMTKAEVEAEGIGGKLAEDGHAIAQLCPSLWNRYTDTYYYGAGADGIPLKEGIAAVIGRNLPGDQAKQMAVWDLAKTDKEIKEKLVAEYIKQVKDSPVETVEELTLFGNEITQKDLTKEKAKLVVSIRDDIKRQGSAHGFVSKGGRAKKLETGTKTTIDVEASKAIAEKSERLLLMLDKTAYTPSDISTILNEGARDIHKGARIANVKKRIMEKLEPLLEKEAQNVFRGKEPKAEEISLFGTAESAGKDPQLPINKANTGRIEGGAGESSAIRRETTESKGIEPEAPEVTAPPEVKPPTQKAVKNGSNVIFTDGSQVEVVSMDADTVEIRPKGQDDTISIPRAEFDGKILSVGDPKTEKLRAGISPADLDPGTLQKIVRWIKKWMSPTGALEPDAAREALVAREAIKESEATAAIMGKKLTKGLTEKQQQAIGKVVIGDYPDAGAMATAEGIPLKEAKDLFKLGREAADIMTYFGEELAKRGLLTKESLAKYGGIYMGRLFRKWEYRHMPTELLNEIAEMLLKKGDPQGKKWAEVAMRLADREKQFAFEQTIQDEIRKAANDPTLSSDTKLPGFTKVMGEDWLYTENGEIGLAGRWVRDDIYKTLKASIDNARLSRKKLGKWMNAKSSDLGEGMDMSYLKQRKDLPDEYREFLGEILEPAYPIARRIQQMGEDIAKYDFYDYMAKNYSSANNLGGKLKRVEGKAFGKLEGRYMLPEYVDSIKEYEEMSGFWGKLNQGLKLWKELHTVWSPGTHSRNVQNNVMTYGIIYGFSAIEEVAPTIGNFVNDDTLLEIAKRANVFGGSYFEEKGGTKQFIDNFADIKDMEGFLKKLLEVVNVRAHAKAAYKFEDDFFKLMAFRRELKAAGIDIEKLTTDWNKMTFREQREWIKNIGAKPSVEARNAITSYDRMGKLPRLLSQYPGSLIPVGGDPFISFPYSFATRTIPKIFKQGAGSQLRFLLALLIPAAVAAYTWHKNQTTAQKEIAQRPEYMRKTSDWAKKKGMDEKYIPLVSMLFDGYLPLPFKDKHGRNLYWDSSNTLAWQDLAKVDENTALIKDPVSRTIAEISANKNFFTNQKIWLDSDSEEVILKKKAMHIWRAAAPSFAPGGYSWEKWKAAYRGAEDYYGRTRDKGMVALDTLLGIKITPVEPKTTAYYEIKKDRESLEELWSKTRQVENLRDRKTLSPKEAEKELIYLKERIRTVAKSISDNLENQEVQRAELIRVKSLIIKLAKTGYLSQKEATDIFKKMTQRAKGLKGVPPKIYDYGRIRTEGAAKRP